MDNCRRGESLQNCFIKKFLLVALSFAMPATMLAFGAGSWAQSASGFSCKREQSVQDETRLAGLQAAHLRKFAHAAAFEGSENNWKGIDRSDKLFQGGRNPKISIIIDDLGTDLDGIRSLLNIDAPISFAILPYLSFSKAVAQEAMSRGKTILLHAPMEPHSFPEADPGQGALFTGMSSLMIERELSAAYESLGYAEGLNNHMGSKFTEDPSAMRATMNFVKNKGLFFIDSVTSPHTIAYGLAKRMGIRAAKRDLFLDNEGDFNSVVRAIGQLARLARTHGQALAIGHPHTSTIQALTEILPRLKSEGFEIVPVDDLLDDLPSYSGRC